MDINDFLDRQSDRARRCAEVASWYANNFAERLSEYARYAHRTVCDFIEAVRDTCKDMSDVLKLLDHKKFIAFNEYKFFQREHFELFAELSMIKRIVLDSIDSEANNFIQNKENKS